MAAVTIHSDFEAPQNKVCNCFHCFSIYLQWSKKTLSEKAMAPHSSTLAWRIPWMEEPVRLQSMGSLESDRTERLHFHFSLSCIGEGMATHSSVLAWRIPGTGEPGGLPSMESHRVGHDWSDLAAACLIHAEVWQKTTKFCKAIILQ